jgi:hypothetical protein
MILVQSREDRRNFADWSQDLIFFPGPSFMNDLSTEALYKEREKDLRGLITPSDPRCEQWLIEVIKVYGAHLDRIGIDVREGGMLGYLMPTLAIDMIGTLFEVDGGLKNRMNETTPEYAEALCRSLAYATGANWVVPWYLGAFRGFKVEYGNPSRRPGKKRARRLVPAK